ncbi:MAG: hypothetical protein ACOY90_10555 [Candidatus Zhuqueibacterota bacterium]
MSRTKKSIAERLNAAQVAISNTLADAEIQAAVAAYGYSAEKINAGKGLYDRAVAAVNAQIAAAGEQRDTSAGMDAAKQKANTAYQSLAKVARAIFIKDKSKLTGLGLTGTMPKSTAGFLTAAYALFENAKTAEIQSLLVTYGYDSAKLQSERALIEAYDTANRSQEQAKGAAQQATRDQDAALKELDLWHNQYIKIARVALQGKKEMLEKLGIRSLSSKTAAQRGAPAKAATTRQANKSAGEK